MVVEGLAWRSASVYKPFLALCLRIRSMYAVFASIRRWEVVPAKEKRHEIT